LPIESNFVFVEYEENSFKHQIPPWFVNLTRAYLKSSIKINILYLAAHKEQFFFLFILPRNNLPSIKKHLKQFYVKPLITI
jgi:hypothetical protein